MDCIMMGLNYSNFHPIVDIPCGAVYVAAKWVWCSGCQSLNYQTYWQAILPDFTDHIESAQQIKGGVGCFTNDARYLDPNFNSSFCVMEHVVMVTV